VPDFALVYYRGANDAWVGYGGAVVYTRESRLPDSLIPRLRESVKKVNFDFDKDFTITDNTCRVQTDKDKLVLREQFAGNVVIQSEKQLQSEVVKARGMAVNNVKAQQLFVTDEYKMAQNAFDRLENSVASFEKELASEVVKDVTFVEKEVIKDIVNVEKEVVKDVVNIEKEIVKDVTVLEKEIVKDASVLEKEIVKDVSGIEKEVEKDVKSTVGLFKK